MSERTTTNQRKLIEKPERPKGDGKRMFTCETAEFSFWYMYVRAYIANYVCEKLRTTKCCTTILNYLITKYRIVDVVEHRTHIAVVVMHMCSPTLVRWKAMSAIQTHTLTWAWAWAQAYITHVRICRYVLRIDAATLFRSIVCSPSSQPEHTNTDAFNYV